MKARTKHDQDDRAAMIDLDWRFRYHERVQESAIRMIHTDSKSNKFLGYQSLESLMVRMLLGFFLLFWGLGCDSPESTKVGPPSEIGSREQATDTDTDPVTKAPRRIATH